MQCILKYSLSSLVECPSISMYALPCGQGYDSDLWDFRF